MKGYTKEMIKEILGSSWPTMPEDHETGNQMRRRKGNEMRAGLRPYPTYPAKKVGPVSYTHLTLPTICSV